MKTTVIELNVNGETSRHPLHLTLVNENLQSFEELKARWEARRWNGHFALVELKKYYIADPEDVFVCDSWKIWCFESEKLDSAEMIANVDGDIVPLKFASYEAEAEYFGDQPSNKFHKEYND